MGDAQLMALYVTSKVFNLDIFSALNIDNRKYSFDGNVIYDFKRKSLARVFQINRNEFKIFDYGMGNYLMISKFDNNLGVYMA